MPRRAAAVGDAGAPRPSAKRDRTADVARRVPNRTPSRVATPEPSSPASPTISPGRASNDTSRSSLVDRQALDDDAGRREHRRSDRGPRPVRGGNSSAGDVPTIASTTSGHGGRRALDGQHHAAVAHDGDPVGDLEHLLEAVRDVEDGDAVGGQLAQDREQPPRLALVERRVGLVEDQHPRPLDEHPAQLDQLALADAEAADDGVRVGGQADAPEDRHRPAAHLGAIHQAEPGRLVGRGTGWPGPSRSGNRLSSW